MSERPRLRPGRGGVARLAAVLSFAVVAPIAAVTAGSAEAASAGADWRTPAEAAGYETTPRAAETVAYARRLAAKAPRVLRVESFGRSPEGRDLVIVIASKDGVFDPTALHRAGRPIVLVQNGIHAGEMDGKDASLALLRDMAVTRTRSALLDRAVAVVILIYNVDGHERFGPYNRINQDGPKEAGWRTQADNLNLNRDYMKADAPETRAFLRLWNRWLPDLFVDTHVTDGADFQYDTTYGVDTGPDVDPALANWKRDILGPYLETALEGAGHLVCPYINLKDDADPGRGITIAQDPPRFSTGYVNLQNRPAVLLETHMLKPYARRVDGSYHVLRALFEIVNRDASLLIAMNRAADGRVIAAGRRADPAAAFPLRLESDGSSVPVRFLGYRWTTGPSDVSGGTRVAYSREPIELTVPRETTLKTTLAVAPPVGYIVPSSWPRAVEVLRAHGLRLRTLARAWEGAVGTWRCEGTVWHPRPFEGRQVLFSPGEGGTRSEATVGDCREAIERMAFPPGSVVVPLDQRAARVAIHLLEPRAPDSLLAWGFFNAVFERKEYAEPYVMEAMALDMLEKDPALRGEFGRRLKQDKAFAGSPEQRLDFFYRRTPYWDARLGLLPVARLTTLSGMPFTPAPAR